MDGLNGAGLIETDVSSLELLTSKLDNESTHQTLDRMELPSQDNGGFSSVVSDDRFAYLSLVWHRDEPTKERTVNDIVLGKWVPKS